MCAMRAGKLLMQDTFISWIEKTSGPVRGCDLVSAGCMNLYASAFSERFGEFPSMPNSMVGA